MLYRPQREQPKKKYKKEEEALNLGVPGKVLDPLY